MAFDGPNAERLVDPGHNLRALDDLILRQEPLDVKKNAISTAAVAITVLEQYGTTSDKTAAAGAANVAVIVRWDTCALTVRIAQSRARSCVCPQSLRETGRPGVGLEGMRNG